MHTVQQSHQTWYILCFELTSKKRVLVDFYAGDYFLVHQFQCFISLEATKTSLILIQIEENWVLWWKLVAN